jgi:hypothetical protein
MLVLVLAALLAGANFGCKSEQPLDKPAVQGRGLLPPVSAQGKLYSAFVKNTFQAESNGLGTRILFHTQGESFKVTVRELMLPPQTGPLSVERLGPAVLEMRTEKGSLKIDKKKQRWTQGGTVMISGSSSIELTNSTERELVVRLYVLEAK